MRKEEMCDSIKRWAESAEYPELLLPKIEFYFVPCDKKVNEIPCLALKQAILEGLNRVSPSEIEELYYDIFGEIP